LALKETFGRRSALAKFFNSVLNTQCAESTESISTPFCFPFILIYSHYILTERRYQTGSIVCRIVRVSGVACKTSSHLSRRLGTAPHPQIRHLRSADDKIDGAASESQQAQLIERAFLRNPIGLGRLSAVFCSFPTLSGPIKSRERSGH
jgi:hypothetical protein